MKKSKALISVLFTVALLSGALTLSFMLLIPAELAPPETQAQENISGIYYSEDVLPETLLFCFADGSGVLLHLDFPALLTGAYVFEENCEENASLLPYQITYKFYADEDFLPLLADRLGGVEAEDEKGEKKTYFSAAVREFFQKKPDEENRKKLAVAFFEKFSKTGLSSEDFMFIIEETKTNLVYSVCYDWLPLVKVMFSNYLLN